MKYGLPYKGSKNKLAERIVGLFPRKKHFYDLFCGGCSVTHRALIENKFDTYLINDINPMCTALFKDAIEGKFKDEKRWISREEFFKSEEPYVKFCWSFGNNCRTYLYSKEIEPYKKACHYAIVFDKWKELERLCPEVIDVTKQALNGISDIQERRLKFGPAVIKELKRIGDWQLVQNNPLYKSCIWRGGKLDGKNIDLQSLKRLQSLESLERLERLERLQSLESLERLNKSYDEIHIEPDSIVYCDIPYKDTDKYSTDFDHEKFYEWCKEQTELTFISSYEMPEKDFICVAEYEHISILCSNKTNKVKEKVFIPMHQKEKWEREKWYAMELFG